MGADASFCPTRLPVEGCPVFSRREGGNRLASGPRGKDRTMIVVVVLSPILMLGLLLMLDRYEGAMLSPPSTYPRASGLLDVVSRKQSRSGRPGRAPRNHPDRLAVGGARTGAWHKSFAYRPWCGVDQRQDRAGGRPSTR